MYKNNSRSFKKSQINFHYQMAFKVPDLTYFIHYKMPVSNLVLQLQITINKVISGPMCVV